MIHKISDFCLKIDGVKKTSDRLYNLKYNNPKTPERDMQIQELIDKIKATLDESLVGVNLVFTQPVELRFNELLEGVREDIAVKL